MNYNFKSLFLLLSISILLINGCITLKSQKANLTNNCLEPVETYDAGKSVNGKIINYTKLGSGPNVTLILASIHGSERAAVPLLNHFQQYLSENCKLLKGNTVIIMPIANPDGFEKKTRYNKNEIDLNRNFPAANRINNEHNGSFALSEPESYILYKIVNTYKPSRVITFHEALNCIDYDGPAEELAKRLADKCKLPLHKVGAQPGSFGSYVGIDLNIPIITVEFSEEDSKKSQLQLWNDYKDLLIEAISY
jgi:protein MpaA